MNGLFASYMEGQLRDALVDIEMPESYYSKAVRSYESIACHITRENSSLVKFGPEIILQGSIKTGTAVRPIFDEGSYDVDMVCNLSELGKNDISQLDLKRLVGVEIKAYSAARAMNTPPRDGKRCWTLEYVDEANFHVDILPTVDDTEQRSAALHMAGKNTSYNDSYLAHTDKRCESYSKISSDWPTTNPRGYAKWFFEVMELDKHRRYFARAKNVDVEEIANHQIKAPLQQYVQLLKRHRDIFFHSHSELTPVKSIVVTTLAGRAYEAIAVKKGWYEDFVSVVTTMPSFLIGVSNDYQVLNPSDPLENFVAEWGEHEADSFLAWQKAVRSDLLLDSMGSLKGAKNRYARKEIRRSLGLRDRSLSLPSLGRREYVHSLSHHQDHGLTEIDAIEVRVFAEKTRSGGIPKRFRSGEPLLKGVSLKFTAEADGIKNFTVRWQVTNDGIEALRSNCLRGDFYPGFSLSDGRRARTEETAYAGEHYVECVLEKDGVVYGRSEPFVVNITDGGGAQISW